MRIATRSQIILGISWVLFFSLLGLFALSWSQGGLAYTLLRQELSAEERIHSLQQSFHQMGALAPLGYVLFVIIEVIIAPIPGLLLYAPGGMLFGGFWGGTLSLLGNVLGAGIACQIANSLSGRWRARLAGRDDNSQLRRKLEQRGVWFVLSLRVNPLTSSDIVSYAAGLAGMRTDRLMLGTLLGMAPLCYAQSYLSKNLFEWLPQLIYPLVALTIVYVCVVLALLVRWTLGRSVNPSGDSSSKPGC